MFAKLLKSVMKARLIVAGATLIMATSVGTSMAGHDGRNDGSGSFYKDMGKASSLGGGVVSSRHREASEAGLKILNEGGNAMDAAAATMFAVGVASFESCGIGGGGFLVYRSAEGETAALDFREWSPKEYEFTYGTGIAPGVFHFGTGHNVVGIPGAVAGIDKALKRFGTRSLAQVLAPGEKLAREGFTVERRTAALMRDPFHTSRVSAFPNTARQYQPAVLADAAGQKFTLPELAEDYEELAKYGARAFYDPEHEGGTIADDLLAEMDRKSSYQGDQATWDASDLTEYEAIWRTPVATTYRGAEVTGMPAPSSAGATIAQMLNILEGFDLPAVDQRSADRIHLVAEAQKLAWLDRKAHLADPAFTPTPPHLITKAYADKQRTRIKREEAQTFVESETKDAEGDNTHNLAVIDKWGNAASINCSIERALGSAVVAHGTGFLLNNQLTDFEGEPGPPKDPKGPANGWAPRKRPRSSMAPTIVVRDGRPLLVTGGIGGPNIIASTANIALNVLDFGQDVAHAVDAPRGEARGLCTSEGLKLCLEEARILPSVLEELGRRGHQVANYRPWGDWACSAPPDDPGGKGCEYSLLEYNQAAGFNPDTGTTDAATDSRFMAAGNVTTAQGAVAQQDKGKRKGKPPKR